MDKEDGAHDDIGHAVMRQALDLWISPEVARRQALDRIPTPFTLRAGQVLISPREGQPIVRLNEEVKGVVRATTTRAIDAGEAVTRSDIGEMSDFELIEDELDYGHITLLEHDGVWLVTFSFLYNRSKSREFHRAALDFLMAARISSEHGLVRPVVENLLHAVENAAKARLLETPGNPFHSGEIPRRNSHEHVRTQIAKYERATDPEDRTSRLLKRLTELRAAATYLDGRFELSEATAQALVDDVDRLIGQRSRASVGDTQ